MKKPFSSLKIAGKRHSVLWNVDLGGDCGKIEYLPLRISIAADLAADEARESLLHEVMHAVDYQSDTGLKEEQVRQLSIGLFEALRANPKLVAYLIEDEEDEDGSRVS